MLTSLSLALLLVQQVPEGAPHPSHPIPTDHHQSLAGLVFGNDRPAWVAVSTAWLGGDAEGYREYSLRVDFARQEALRMGLEMEEGERWFQEHATGPVSLSYRISSAGKELLSGLEQVQLGRAASAADWSASAAVLDFDVEIASVSSIADPITGSRYLGRSLAVRLLPVPGVGWLAEGALVDTASQPAGEIATGNADIPPLERLSTRVVEAEFSVLLTPEQPGRVRVPGPDGQPLEIELSAAGATPAEAQSFGRGSWVDASALVADRKAWQRFAENWRGSTEAFLDASGMMVVEGDDPAALARMVGEEVRAAMQPLDLHLTWTVEKDGAVLLSDSARLATPAGRALRFAHGELTRVLEDWDVEVALASRIPDPRFRDLFGGVRCEASARPIGSAYQVDLDLEFSLVSLREPRELLLAASAPPRDTSEGMAPSAHEQRVKVDQATRGETAFRGSYRTDGDGLLVLERSAEQVYGEGARIRVEVRVAGE